MEHLSAKQRLHLESELRFKLLTQNLGKGASGQSKAGKGRFIDTHKSHQEVVYKRNKTTDVVRTARMLAARGMGRGGIRYEEIKTECIRQYGLDEFYAHKKEIVKSLQREGVKVKARWTAHATRRHRPRSLTTPAKELWPCDCSIA